MNCLQLLQMAKWLGDKAQCSWLQEMRNLVSCKQIWRLVMETQTENGLSIRRLEYNSINDQPLDTTIDTSLERAFYMFQLAKAI